MNKKYFIVLIFLFAFISSKAQYRKFNNPIWTIGTAKTVAKKQLNLNLLYYSQYGLTNNIEIQTKPLWWYKFPNLGVKITWWQRETQPSADFFKKLGIIIGSKHGIYYPTPIMNYIQERNIQDIDFGSAVIPPIVAFKNELLITTIINKNKGCYKNKSILTFKFGNQMAIKNPDNNFVVTDKALLFRQTSIFGDYSLWYIGIDFDAKINYGLNYCIDIDFYSVSLNMNNWIFEHKGLVYWYMGAKHRIRPSIGYQLSYTNLPSAKLSLYPLFDLTYIIHIKKKRDNKKIFDNGMMYDAYDDREEIEKEKRKQDKIQKKKNKKNEKKNKKK